MASDRKSRFDYKGPINKNWNKKPKRTLDRPKPDAAKAAAPSPGKPKRLAGALGAGAPAATTPKAKPKRPATTGVANKPKARPTAVASKPKAKPLRQTIAAAPKPDAPRKRKSGDSGKSLGAALGLKAIGRQRAGVTVTPTMAKPKSAPKKTRETSISISNETATGRVLNYVIGGAPSRTTAQRKKRADEIRGSATNPSHPKPKAKPRKGRKITGYKMNLDGSNRTPVYAPDFSRAVGATKKSRRS